ncbi:MAG: FG-GAP-like repeat-containing protein, partial [Gemmatimonadota bacterium]|nr:FG-GAP-like repeat-containing protein [Gemmatimonadota bacterium]
FNEGRPAPLESVSMGRYQALSQKIMAAVAAGGPPDVAQCYEAWTANLIENGSLVPLSPRETGIEAATDLGVERVVADRTLSLGTGVAIGDVDGDGWADLYLPLLDGANVLYRNLGGWRFEDVTAAAGAAALPDRMSRGATFADADGDGDLDLFVTIHAGPNTLLLNDGSGVFAEAASGFAGAWGTTTVTLADVDGDGDLDPYFANYKTAMAQDIFPPEERTSRNMVVEDEDGELRIRPPYDEHYAVIRIGENRMRRWETADPDEFYLNDGDGAFMPVPFTGGGFVSAMGEPLDTAPRDWGLVARFYDFDDDHRPDLYVSNDFGSADGIWVNAGGVFRAVPGLAIRTTTASSMGVDFADIDRDGDTDFITTEMPAFDPVERRTEMGFVSIPSFPPGATGERSTALRNVLQLNRGDGTFAEVARAAGVAATDWTWAALFLDADLDGYEDLFVTNGNVWNALHGDTHDALRTGRIALDWRREVSAFPPMPQRNLAFRNRGDGTFEETSAAWGYGGEPDVSFGIATGDLDRDGDLDVVITRFDEPPLVLRNDARGPRVALRLVGAAPNTRAIGARVTVQGDGAPPQSRQVTAGGMYLSGSDQLLVFAAGSSGTARVTVSWPSGAMTTLDVTPDRLYEIREPEGTRGTTGGDARPGGGVEGIEPLFERVESGAIHRETVFNEAMRQPLIPLELSRLGPGVTWEDVDRDGDVDLVTSAAAGTPTVVVRTENGRLLAPSTVGPPAPGDLTTVFGVHASDGYALVAGVSNWEGTTPEELQRIPSLVDLAAGDVLLPGQFNTVGPLAQADIDGDGDLDLFMGGRAVPGAYPLPATSRLVRNDGDRWVEDPQQAEVFRSLGLVSGAVFSDVDADGDPDLLLALDWGPVRLFLNEGGRLTDATDAWGLGDLPGRWNGIATGDLDGDGLPDLVATSWGWNTGITATPERPALVFAGDFDANGQVDVIEAWTDPRGRAIPVRDYTTLTRALPFIRADVPSFEAFSAASVDELVGGRGSAEYRASAETLAHTVFLNRGGRFETAALPRPAQLAPAFGVVVADFDRDGNEDVYIAQNFFATPQGIERHDAGRGALLLGDGEGGFAAGDEGALGVTVYGDARGAAVADYDADGRWDLAVGQNGEET